MKKAACAYYRTSSTSGVNKPDEIEAELKDSHERQRLAVEIYAARAGYEIVGEYYDKGVSGTVHNMDRPEFTRMVDYIEGNGARVVLVETASRFARDLLVQLIGHQYLKDKGIELVPVDAPTYFTDENETAELIRNVLGAVSQFEKKANWRRMHAGRMRKKEREGWCGGQRRVPAAHIAYALAHKKAAPSLSYRQISSLLADQGFVQQKSGRPYNPQSIKYMLTEKK